VIFETMTSSAELVDGSASTPSMRRYRYFTQLSHAISPTGGKG
jgi:hypothetical protein